MSRDATITKKDGTGSDGISKPESHDVIKSIATLDMLEKKDETDKPEDEYKETIEFNDSGDNLRWDVLPGGLVLDVDVDSKQDEKLKNEYNTVFNAVKEELKINDALTVAHFALDYKDYMSENCYKMFKTVSEG